MEERDERHGGEKCTKSGQERRRHEVNGGERVVDRETEKRERERERENIEDIDG